MRDGIAAEGHVTIGEVHGKQTLKNFAILGASGHGKVLADMAELLGWQNVVFFDDTWPQCVQNGHWSVVGSTDELLAQISEFDGVVVGIGDNSVRLEKQALLESYTASIASLVHPNAQVSLHANIGNGTVVMAGAVINSDARVGDACIINTGAVVDHDCVLEAGVHISPNAALAGGVKVGQSAWVGIGASVRQLINIGANAVVGAGAVVVKDVPNTVTQVGNPARTFNRD